MADNVKVTPGSGGSAVPIATDDVGGVQFQKIKLDVGTDGVSAPLSTTNPLPTVLPTAAQTGSGAIRIGTTSTKFFEAFDSWPDTSTWDGTLAASDMAASLGNAAGVSYVGLMKSISTPDTVTEYISKVSVATPLEIIIGLSLSNQILGQMFTFDLVGVDANGNIEADASPASNTITSITVTSNVVTVTTSTAHGYQVGNMVALSGNLDNRFNQGPVAITAKPSATKFSFAYTIGDGTYSAGGLGIVDLVCPCAGAHNSAGITLMETNDDNVRYFTRGSSGPVFFSGSSSLGTDWRQSSIPSGYDVANTDAHNARASARIRYRQEDFVLQSFTNDNNGTPLSAGYMRTQNLPDPRKEYKLRFRAVNLKNLTRPIATISTISKSASTTVTVTTATNHGLTTGNYVSITGVADQTNFPNTQNVTITVTGANTFTCVVGPSATDSDTGGTVWLCEGNQNAPVLGQVVNSIARTSNVMTITCSATVSGISRGEWVTLHGMTGSATQYEGTYKVLNLTGSSLVLESTGADFGSISTSGSIAEVTIFRLHQLAALDFTRNLTEIIGARGHNYDREAINVRGTVTATATGTYSVVGAAADSGTASGNPVLVGGRIRTGIQTDYADGDHANLRMDQNGRVIIAPSAADGGNRLLAYGASPKTATGNTQIFAAQGSNTRGAIDTIWLKNTGSGTAYVILNDNTTERLRITVGANMTSYEKFELKGAVRSTANTVLNLDLSTATNISLEWIVEGFKEY